MQDIFQSRLFRTRGGALIAGAIAALLAAVLLIIYLHSYRSSVNSGKKPVQVLVAKSLIPKGTSGTIIAHKSLYQVTTVPKDQLKNLAISDPSVLNDRVTASDVFPGQQLTQDDFTTETGTGVPYDITGPQRAIAVPVDATHGLIGQVQDGSFVDVYVGVDATNGSGSTNASPAVVTLLASNILVLVAPTGTAGNAVLRVNTLQAARFAFAADNAKVWLVLRPQSGASKTPPAFVTLDTLLKAGQAGAATSTGG